MDYSELKESYFNIATKNLENIERSLKTDYLLDMNALVPTKDR